MTEEHVDAGPPRGSGAQYVREALVLAAPLGRPKLPALRPLRPHPSRSSAQAITARGVWRRSILWTPKAAATGPWGGRESTQLGKCISGYLSSMKISPSLLEGPTANI